MEGTTHSDTPRRFQERRLSREVRFRIMKSVKQMPVRMIPKNINQSYRSSKVIDRQNKCLSRLDLTVCDASPVVFLILATKMNVGSDGSSATMTSAQGVRVSQAAAAASRNEQPLPPASISSCSTTAPASQSSMLQPWHSPPVPTRGCACRPCRVGAAGRPDPTAASRRVLLVDLATVHPSSDLASGSTHRELPPMA